MFLLEEDEDYGNLFITQESSQNVSDGIINEGYNDEKDCEFLAVSEADFNSLCASLIPCECMYLDISDEVFQDSKGNSPTQM